MSQDMLLIISAVLSILATIFAVTSIYYYLLYKKTISKIGCTPKILHSGTVAISSGPLASKNIKIDYQGADQLPQISHDSPNFTTVRFGRNVLFLNNIDGFVDINIKDKVFGVKVYSASNKILIYPVFIGSWEK
jgi:hypothetical protein